MEDALARALDELLTLSGGSVENGKLLRGRVNSNKTDITEAVDSLRLR